MHDGMGTQSAPALLTLLAGPLAERGLLYTVAIEVQKNAIAIVDRHAESELRSVFQVRQTERRFRQFYFVSGFFPGEVAFNDGFSGTVTGWISARTWIAVGERLVVDNYLGSQIRIGDQGPRRV